MSKGGWARWQVVLAVGIGVFLYVRSPIDLLPDRMGPLGLLDDLIVLGVALSWVRRYLGDGGPGSEPATPPPHGSSDTTPSDPYEILEVTRDASPAEITRAYREQMKRYHPDRVAGLGDELQRLAHERTITIQRAYDTIGRR